MTHSGVGPLMALAFEFVIAKPQATAEALALVREFTRTRKKRWRNCCSQTRNWRSLVRTGFQIARNSSDISQSTKVRLGSESPRSPPVDRFLRLCWSEFRQLESFDG